MAKMLKKKNQRPGAKKNRDNAAKLAAAKELQINNFFDQMIAWARLMDRYNAVRMAVNQNAITITAIEELEKWANVTDQHTLAMFNDRYATICKIFNPEDDPHLKTKNVNSQFKVLINQLTDWVEGLEKRYLAAIGSFRQHHDELAAKDYGFDKDAFCVTRIIDRLDGPHKYKSIYFNRKTVCRAFGLSNGVVRDCIPHEYATPGKLPNGEVITRVNVQDFVAHVKELKRKPMFQYLNTPDSQILDAISAKLKEGKV